MRTIFQKAQAQDGAWLLMHEAVGERIAQVGSGRFRLGLTPVCRLYEPVPDTHFHARFEVVFQLSGASLWRCVEEVVRLNAGETLLIPRGVAHRERADVAAGPPCNLNVSIGEEGFGFHTHFGNVPEWNGCRRRASVRLERGTQLFGYLRAVGDAFAEGRAPDDSLLTGLMLASLSLIRDGLAVGETPVKRQSHMVNHCLARIWHHLSEPELNVTGLAEEIGCSADYLSHLFHVQTGQTITRFINRERMNLGQHLLRSTTMNISQIAFRCGYRNGNYFARLFKERTGQSPRNYRLALAR